MKQNSVFINLSNHPSKNWSTEQKEEALCNHCAIVDLPFPNVDPNGDEEYINDLVQEYLEKVLSYEKPTVMLQGEFIFSYRLINQLKVHGIKVVAGRSRRKVREEVDENRKIMIVKEFEFAGFMEY